MRLIDALPIGTALDGLEIETILGQGDFGITYAAASQTAPGRVAVKEYFPHPMVTRAGDGVTMVARNPDLAEDVAFGLDRFVGEGRAVEAIRHPAVVGIREIVAANETAYLVMDFVEGSPLNWLLRDGPPLTEHDVRSLLMPLLDGLEALHAAGLRHGAIRPGNIYIDVEGRPVLLDFGQARNDLQRRVAGKVDWHTNDEGFDPIETLSEDPGAAGPWSDIYALGATLYRIVTGKLPPKASVRLGDPDGGMEAGARANAAGTYSSDLLAAIDAALTLDPAKRPRSVAALRTILGGAV